jgi:hypothetical protein
LLDRPLVKVFVVFHRSEDKREQGLGNRFEGRPSPYPITPRERGAQREGVFFGEDDNPLYRDLLVSQCRKHARRGLVPIAHAQPPSSHSRSRPRGGARARARRGAPREIGKRRSEVVTPAKAGVQRRRHRLLENQLFSVS